MHDSVLPDFRPTQEQQDRIRMYAAKQLAAVTFI
jgi:hypothetical protein